MSDDKRARLKQWLESGEARLHPLSFPQRELWEASATPVNDASNHICSLIYIRGLLKQQDCEAAMRRVVERQEVLRLSFLPGKERPLQLVRARGESHLEFRDVAAGDRRPEAVEELAQSIFNEPFDIVQGPLYRAVMLRRAPDDLVVAFATHHAIADGWSLGVFIQDLFAAYMQSAMGQDGPLPPVPLTYTAWAAAERAAWPPAEIEPRAAFWKAKLAGAPRLWSPSNTPGACDRWTAQISAEFGTGIRELARRSGATLFSTLLTAFQATLAEWTGADDIVLTTPVANRGKPAIREAMGYCSGNVPLRCQVDRALPFVESLRAVQEMTVDAFAQAMPFAELVAALGDPPAPGHHPICDVRFALQNHPVPDVTLPNLSAKLRMRSSGTARFDLACEITEHGEAMEVVWYFRTHRFSGADIEELHRLFHSALTNACRAPERRIAALMTTAQ